jgi:hypothetical protein
VDILTPDFYFACAWTLEHFHIHLLPACMG